MKENHDDPHSGYSGFYKTFNRIKMKYKWPNMKNEIKKYVKRFESCQKNKVLRKTYKAPMQITSTANQPFEKFNMDIVGPIPITENGNQYLLTLQDDLTKFSQAYAIQSQNAKAIAQTSLKLISHMGIPKT